MVIVDGICIFVNFVQHKKHKSPNSCTEEGILTSLNTQELKHPYGNFVIDVGISILDK